MKRMAMAGLLAAALALAPVSQQKAAAWGCGDCWGCGGCNPCCASCGGNWGFGFSFSFTHSGCSTACFSPCAYAAPCYCPPAPSICEGGYIATGYGYPTAGYPVAPAAAGYGDGAGYGYAYSAPSYWYGR